MASTENSSLTARETLRLTFSEQEDDLAHAFANYPDKDAWLTHFIDCLNQAKKGPALENHVLKSDEDTRYIFRGPATFRVDVQEVDKDYAEAILEVHGRTTILVQNPEAENWGYEILPLKHLVGCCLFFVTTLKAFD